MSIIEAATGTYRSRVDGTIVLSIEIEPRFRADALALFGMPGTPIALAALQTGYAAAGGELQLPKPKTGALCLLAVQWCKNPQFQIWADVQDEESAKQFILATCGIDSRKDLDIGVIAAGLFDYEIRKPYMAYLKANP